MPQLRVAELDFDEIKQNLKIFLQSQSEFADYDFEGSGLSVLMDLLAYNTHYNAYLGNMQLNEAFLDSAVKRASAVSLSKLIGYTPISIKGSVATISVKVINPDNLPPKLTIDAFTPFTSTINGESYNFLTVRSYSASRQGNEYNFSQMKVKEGTLQEFSYVVSDTTPNAKYEIPAIDVDTSTIQVSIQKSATDTTKEIFNLTNDITGVSSTSKVYFLDQNPQERYEIYFGDGIIGQNLEVGNIINIKYLVSKGEVTNVSNKITQTFQSASSIGGSNNISVVTNANSSEGRARENITSIKYNAPKFNAARNRCVVPNDFEVSILTNYSGAESVSVWGGEDNLPPIYGKVFVSLKPFEGFVISDEAKENIKSDILRNKKGVTTVVEFVDPDYIYVGLDVSVDYNYTITTKSSGQIFTLVIAAIEDYFQTNLQKFKATYKHSSLINKIINCDNSVISALATITLQKRIIPILNITNILNSSNALNFRNSIRPGTFISSYFYTMLNGVETLVYIKDLPDTNPPDLLGTGTLRLFDVETLNVINSNIGTIDYGIGVVNINAITPTSLPIGVEDIRFSCGVQERNYNLVSNRNEIFVADDSTEDKIVGTQEGLTLVVNSVA